MSALPIDDVRERLHNLADYAGGGSFPSLAGDLRALLEDHARLQVASPKGNSYAVVREYIAARDAYEEAIKPNSGFASPRKLVHGDPAVIRYRNARIALNELLATSVDGGSEGFGTYYKGSSDAPACMHVTDLAAPLWKEMSNAGFLMGGPDFETESHLIDKARFLAIAATVQDAMQATSAEVGE